MDDKKTKTIEELDEELDKALLGIIRNGEIVVDKKGNIVKLTPSAAILNAARQRLRDLGVNKLIQPNSDIANLAEEMGIENANTLKMPGMELIMDANRDSKTG